MSERFTPNRIMEMLPFSVLEPKPEPDPDLVQKASHTLPLAYTVPEIRGAGDWVRRRSSGGSVVLGGNGIFDAKLPLGDITDSPFEKAATMKASIHHFSSVAPETALIIARADNSQAKPILLQRDVKGAPICHSSLEDIFKLRPLYDLRRILISMKDWHKDHHSHDMFGQKIKMNLVGRSLQFIPFLSDNVMLSENGHIYLVDNILYDRPRPHTPFLEARSFVKKAIFQSQIYFVDSLIFVRRLYNFFSRNREEVASRQGELISTSA